MSVEARAREIEVAALATEAKFTGGARRPPSPDPGPARPDGFVLAERRTEPTFTLILFRTDVPRLVTGRMLERMGLARDLAPAVFLERARAG